jgi:hypothetical protein
MFSVVNKCISSEALLFMPLMLIWHMLKSPVSLLGGVYRGDYGIVYFVHDGRVIMRHLGSYYKTSTHFLFGKWYKELNEGMVSAFNDAYENAQKW